MPRLIGISNRTAAGGSKAGGLAVALWEALAESGGLWFGWSGEVTKTAPRGVELFEEDGVEFAVTDLTEAEHQGFYLGYSNRSLWPVMHYRVDLANFDESEFAIYAEVNRRFAKLIRPRLQRDDVVWVHDYHFMLLGRDLRELGWDGRMGYFLHIPFPPPEIFKSLPDHARLVRGLAAFDVIGFQTTNDRRNFEKYILEEMGAKALGDCRYEVQGRAITIKAYPIGIDADEFARLSVGDAAQVAQSRIKPFLGNRKLILGVDRMDYSKGIPQRFEAMGRLLDHDRDLHGKIAYTQIAPPSRTKVEEYADLRGELDELSGRINGDYGDLDWIPIRYLARSYPRDYLAGLYRIASLCLVTPLHDGMNLVAKEFVAAQDPANPGVLLLSQFAGAAEQLSGGALLVNPHDLSGMADAMREALRMALPERRRRWEAMNKVVNEQDITWWRESFIADLSPDRPLGSSASPAKAGSGSVVALNR
ncbi:alpha,alpha-trehalose-phosphate synthase (UDP-forming) [Parvularcula dongshanensis]|uniref:Trehalose 6-phosphate synthase n=1 Tax=Parvularcula dongshanensis TaxID=1173995 RepID=A0A840I5D8_9PROT|nr:trehalose-6-phosphate synthase [Parvularcula dongshanensis]MBB4659602.1 trehalose 6-phosphate synthase [Parvularcula dongshanensis]